MTQFTAVTIFEQMYRHMMLHAQTCESLLIVSETLFLLGIIQTALFSALRVFALWNQSYALAIPVLILGLVPFGTNLFNYVVYIYYNQTVGGSSSCTTIFPYPQHVRTMLVCLTRSAAIAGDILVLALTWARTFKNWYDGRKLGMDLSVSAYLLRDGTIYFLCLLIINITQLIVVFHWHDDAGTNIVGPFLLVLPPILICRFMINLRSLGSTEPARERSEAMSRSYFSAVSFRVPETALGNIGEALEHEGLSSGSTSSEVLETLAAEEDGIKLSSTVVDGGEPLEISEIP